MHALGPKTPVTEQQPWYSSGHDGLTSLAGEKMMLSRKAFADGRSLSHVAVGNTDARAHL